MERWHPASSISRPYGRRGGPSGPRLRPPRLARHVAVADLDRHRRKVLIRRRLAAPPTAMIVHVAYTTVYSCSSSEDVSNTQSGPGDPGSTPTWSEAGVLSSPPHRHGPGKIGILPPRGYLPGVSLTLAR